jgi:hypothetical protein
MRWREKLAEVAGLPPLQLMDGFYAPLDSRDLPTLYHGMETRNGEYLRQIDQRLPISWNCLKPDVLHQLLYHSDCDGSLETEVCGPLADRLSELLPLLPPTEDNGHIGNWRDKTQKFIDGLRDASAAGEAVEFG